MFLYGFVTFLDRPLKFGQALVVGYAGGWFVIWNVQHRAQTRPFSTSNNANKSSERAQKADEAENLRNVPKRSKTSKTGYSENSEIRAPGRCQGPWATLGFYRIS